MNDKTVRLLRFLALASALLVSVALIWDQGRQQTPDDAALRAARDAFNDQNYDRAATLYTQIVEKNASDLPARRGLANSLVQLRRFDEAHVAIDTVISSEPDNACNYATRGIVEDHRGRHQQAMADYERAVAGCPVARDGMSWWQRVLSNTHEQPPTVAARLAYLKSQMALPEDQRVLRLPEIDRTQKPLSE